MGVSWSGVLPSYLIFEKSSRNSSAVIPAYLLKVKCLFDMNEPPTYPKIIANIDTILIVILICVIIVEKLLNIYRKSMNSFRGKKY